jgi:hypothetical protein
MLQRSLGAIHPSEANDQARALARATCRTIVCSLLGACKTCAEGPPPQRKAGLSEALLLPAICERETPSCFLLPTARRNVRAGLRSLSTEGVSTRSGHLIRPPVRQCTTPSLRGSLHALCAPPRLTAACLTFES